MCEHSEMAVILLEDQLRVVSYVRENYSYVCQDVVMELHKYNANKYQFFQRFKSKHSITGRVN